MAKKIGKWILKSKTFWAALATIATGLGLYFTGEQSLEELLITVIGAIFGVLRLITSEPVMLK